MKPLIVGFLCKWCGYAGADNAGLSRYIYPSNIRIIRVMCSGTVKPEWIIGKARGEIPWFGLIKLVFFGDNIQGEPGWVKIGKAAAPKDEWICLGISLFILIGIPTIWDAYKFYKKWKSEKLRL